MTSRTGLLPALRRQNSENGIRTTRASAGLRLRGGLGPKGAFTDASNRPKPTARLGRPVANLGKQSLGVKPKVRSAMTKRGSVADQENRPVTEALETLTEEKSELEEAPIKPRVRAGDVSPISQSLKLLQEATGDPDSDDINDPQCLASYASDIYHYLWKKERDLAIQEDFLEGKGVKPQHREMLVNWLIQVQMDMRLCQETLYLGIFILDKYCSMEKVLQKSKYQLTGITSLFIASKVEEVGYIPIEDFAEMTDGAVTVSEMKSHEMRILHTIDFVVTRPHALHFLRRDSKVGQSTAEMHAFAKFFVELCVMPYGMASELPSRIAAGSAYISRLLLSKEHIWPAVLHAYSGYSEDEARSAACDVAAVIIQSYSSKYQTIHMKYRSGKHGGVSEALNPKHPVLQQLAANSPKFSSVAPRPSV